MIYKKYRIGSSIKMIRKPMGRAFCDGCAYHDSTKLVTCTLLSNLGDNLMTIMNLEYRTTTLHYTKRTLKYQPCS